MTGRPTNHRNTLWRYHRDPRVLAARKQYRADLRAGMPEPLAWMKAKAVYSQVQAELVSA